MSTKLSTKHQQVDEIPSCWVTFDPVDVLSVDELVIQDKHNTFSEIKGGTVPT